jgi:hypothetical protein
VRAMYITATAGNFVELAVVPDNAERARRLLEGSIFDTPRR